MVSPSSIDTGAKPRVPMISGALAFLCVLIAIGLSWGAMGYALRSLEDVWQDRVEALAEIHGTTAPFYRILPNLAEVGHPVAMDSAAALLTEARAESAKAWRVYLSTTLTEAEVTLMNQTTGPVVQLHVGADTLIQVLRSGDHDRYVRHMNEVFFPQLGVVAARMKALVELQQTVTRERVAEARSQYQSARWFLIGSGVVVAVVGLMGMFSRGRERGSP